MLLLSSEPAANRLARTFFSLIHPFRVVLLFNICSFGSCMHLAHIQSTACTRHYQCGFWAFGAAASLFTKYMWLESLWMRASKSCSDAAQIVSIYDIERSIDRKSSQNGENVAQHGKFHFKFSSFDVCSPLHSFRWKPALDSRHANFTPDLRPIKAHMWMWNRRKSVLCFLAHLLRSLHSFAFAAKSWKFV